MIRSEVASLIASRNPHLYHNEVERIMETISRKLPRPAHGADGLSFAGWAISIRNRAPRSGRNPRDGTSVFVEEKWVQFFKAGKEMQDRLNPANTAMSGD
ncbi:integration host factor subunit beta [Rhizobium sp. SLBN-94]|nr:integration host factor subunit beta [Rhizobium sp. SLBN-94]